MATPLEKNTAKSQIKSIDQNASTLTIGYEFGEGINKATIYVKNINGVYAVDRDLTKAVESVSIDLCEEMAGVCVVDLVTDGIVADSKTIIIKK